MFLRALISSRILPISAVIATAAVGLAALPGCEGDPEAAAEIAESDEDLKLGTTLTEADDNATVAVIAGQPVLVALASNPTTGYGWAVVSTDKTFGYPTVKYVASSKATGSGGTSKMTWATSGPLPMIGKHTVELAYKRSWETTSIKTFRFTVDIRDANPSKQVLVDQADDKAVVLAKVGQDVVLSLPSNATTGYKWTVTATNKTWGYPATDTYKASTSGATGAGGTQTMTWKTSGSPLSKVGTHAVTLGYARPGDAKPAKTFSFTVKVKS